MNLKTAFRRSEIPKIKESFKKLTNIIEKKDDQMELWPLKFPDIIPWNTVPKAPGIINNYY